MCGITAVIRRTPEGVKELLQKMGEAQAHRGPDSTGDLIREVSQGDDVATIALGHQRLSILDLSPCGSQPMISPCKRYALIFNGEIYNYKELRFELDRDDPILNISDGDTAVLFALLVRYGQDALTLLNGMWAFLFVDFERGTVFGSRDRAGQKPLYYSHSESQLLFASEIKSILQGMTARVPVNKDTVARFLFQSLPTSSDETFLEGIRSVPAGSWFELPISQFGQGRPTFHRYWKHPVERGEAEIDRDPEEFYQLFQDSIRLHMRSDVPVGVLLSGGLDSSAICAVAKELKLDGRLTLISAVSDDPRMDESVFIDQVGHHLRSRVEKIHIDAAPATLLEELDKTLWYNDQPISSLSVVANRLLMEHAKHLGIIVLLNGQGSDEQLGGYNKFFYHFLADRLKRGKIIEAATMLLGCVLQGTILREFHWREAKRYVPSIRSHVRHQYEGEALKHASLVSFKEADCFRERELQDFKYSSLPSILHYEDRMSMSYSREMRVPFLDARLIEFCGSLTSSRKLSRGWTKRILRDGISSILPESITWRKDKRGFSLPHDKLLRGPWAKELKANLNEDSLAVRSQFLSAQGLQSLLNRYARKDPLINFKDVLNVYTLERWLRVYEQYVVC